MVLATPALAQDGKPAFELKGHEQAILALAFSPDGKRLASVADDAKLKVWDVASKAEIASFDGMATNRNRVAWTPDGASVVALGNGMTIKVCDVAAKKERSFPTGDLRGGAASFSLSPDGKTIAVVGRATLRLFDIESGKQRSETTVHDQHGVQAVAYSKDGKTLATAGTDRKLSLVNAVDGKVTKTFDTEGRGVGLAFAPDGKSIFVCTDNQVVQRIDCAGGEPRTIYEKSLPTLDVQVSADGKLLAIAGAGRGPTITTTVDFKIRQPKLDSDDANKAAAFAPDGKSLAGGANGGVISIWKLAD